MVRGIPGHADAGGVRDPDGGQPAQEPSQPILADQRAGRRGDRRGTAVHAARDLLRFVSLPIALLATIASLALTYLLLVQAVKTWFYRRHAVL